MDSLSWKNPIKINDLGVAPFMETAIWGKHAIFHTHQRSHGRLHVTRFSADAAAEVQNDLARQALTHTHTRM